MTQDNMLKFSATETPDDIVNSDFTQIDDKSFRAVGKSTLVDVVLKLFKKCSISITNPDTVCINNSLIHVESQTEIDQLLFAELTTDLTSENAVQTTKVPVCDASDQAKEVNDDLKTIMSKLKTDIFE